MNRLSEDEIKFITQGSGEGKPLPDCYLYLIPLETKKEYELTSAGKQREEDMWHQDVQNREELKLVLQASRLQKAVTYISPQSDGTGRVNRIRLLSMTRARHP